MSATMLPLRPYQEDALAAAFHAWDWDSLRRPAIVLPTGAGKTVVFAHIVRDWIREGRPGKVVILVHRDELVNQAVKKIRDVAPELAVGVVKGGRNETDAPVIVASVQTLTKPARLAPLRSLVGLVIVDECHHATSPTYRRIMEEFGCFNPAPPEGAPHSVPGALALGVTATMVRADRALLGEVWERVVYTKDILDLIALGYLADVEGRMVTVDGMTLEEVKTSRGDYAASSLSDILISSGAITAVADAYLEHAKGLQTILFAPTVEAADLFTLALVERGVEAATVWGAMGEDLRRATLRRFDEGHIQVLSNCMVLTEGYDSPTAACAIIARPTKSAGLYTQMVGRVLRPHPSKGKALVLDVVGASMEHALATIVDLSTERVARPLEGESLMEAAQRAQREGSLDLAGTFSYEDVDLFHRSASVWLQTKEGCWFINAKPREGLEEYFVTVWPTEKGFNVSRVNAKKRGAVTLHSDLPLDTAMSWAEEEAAELGSMTASRRASWRRRIEPASEAQRKLAERLGIEFPAEVSKRALADLLTIHFASVRLDMAFRNVKI